MIDYKSYLNDHTVDELLDVVKKEQCVIALDYDSFLIFKDPKSMKYYCIDRDDCEISEVKLVAQLTYDIYHDLQVPAEDAGIRMAELFDCSYCGESVEDNMIEYLWFEHV